MRSINAPRDKAQVLKLEPVNVSAIPSFSNGHEILLKFGLSERLYFCTVNSIRLEFYTVCQFFFICESNDVFVIIIIIIYFEKLLSYILSPGGFVESSFTFLDLAGLDHHLTTLGGTRKAGTDIPVVADCLACS